MTGTVSAFLLFLLCDETGWIVTKTPVSIKKTYLKNDENLKLVFSEVFMAFYLFGFFVITGNGAGSGRYSRINAISWPI